MAEENGNGLFRYSSPANVFSTNRFGGPTAIRSQDLTVGTSPQQLISPNPNRVQLVLINRSSSDIYVLPEPGVSSTYGLVLSADGGSFKMDVEADGSAVCTELHFVGPSAGLHVTFLETYVIAEG